MNICKIMYYLKIISDILFKTFLNKNCYYLKIITMLNSYEEIKSKLSEVGLKTTTQRIAVLEAVNSLNHPSADQIADHVNIKHPAIALGTIYNILDSFVDIGIIKKIKTEKGVMRYDSILKNHHHIYCSECDLIDDYYNEELDRMLESFFKGKEIPGFKIEDIKLQIVGRHLK